VPIFTQRGLPHREEEANPKSPTKPISDGRALTVEWITGR
jgi:hypothetical protein